MTDDSRANPPARRPDSRGGQVPGQHAHGGERPEKRLDELSLLGLMNVLLKRWRLLVGLPVVTALLAAGVSLLIPSRFAARASFVPEAQSGETGLSGGLVGLAAQFGVPLPGAGTGSPEFYASVLRSRTLLDRILASRFPDPRDSLPADTATLLDILEVKGTTEPERFERARRLLLSKVVSVSVEDRTNVVSVSATTRYPALSADVANHMLDVLSDFNLRTRQSRARQRREFVEERVGTLRNDLREAEDELQAFLERNRSYQQSPELTFEYERLQRQVAMKQEVFTSLQRSYEEARLQEVNDAPVITVIDRAVPPVKKSSPNRRLNVVLAFVLGAIAAVVGAFGGDFLERARRRGSSEYRELVMSWDVIKTEIRSLPRRSDVHHS